MRMWYSALSSSFLLFSALGFARSPWIATTQQIASTHLIQTPRDWINVKTDFGAIGDGIANDTVAFANAIAAFDTSNRASFILVPPGTYQVDNIKIVGGTYLKGSGKSKTIIRARTTGVGAGIMRLDGHHVQEATVENLQLQGFLYGIDARSVYYSAFRNLYVWNCTTGIYLGRRNHDEGLTIGDVFSDIRVAGSTAFTLDVDISTPGDLVNACQFYSCIFESNTNKPVRFRGQGGNGLAGNSFHGCSLQGAQLSLTQCNGIGWFGGYVEGAAIDAASNVGGLTVSGTYFQVGSDIGIRLGTNAGGVVRGVTIGACTFATTGGGTAIEIRPDISSESDGIVLLPNEYLGTITPISDTAGIAEVTVTPGAVLVKGYVAVSNTAARVMAGAAIPEGVVGAAVGSLYLRTIGGTALTLYVKETGGMGPWGWTAK